jgi:hypothetical protein
LPLSKESRKDLGKLSTYRIKGIKIQKKMVPALPAFKRVLQIQKHLVLSGSELVNLILYQRES